MADFTFSQIKKLDELLNENGYTPLIADNTKDYEIFFNLLGINIFAKYNDGSSAKTLKKFWLKSTNKEALKVIVEIKKILLETIDDNYEFKKLNSFFEEIEKTLEDKMNEFVFDIGLQINIVNNYTIVKELGYGSFGDVYLIKDELENNFVVKKYRESSLIDEENTAFAEKFKDEAKLLHTICHQNIIKVYNYNLGKTPYYIMEYVDGKNIEDFIKENPNDINFIFNQLIDVFEYLEKLCILHRDIRPHNILISKNKEVKLIDFGFGKTFENNGTIKSKTKLISHIYEIPEEMKGTKPIYTNKTEIYFIGNCLTDIINDNNIINFKYNEILTKMSNNKVAERYSSFKEIKELIRVNKISNDVNLKVFYNELINKLKAVNVIYTKDTYIYSLNEIIRNLEELKDKNQLKDELNYSEEFLLCFISSFSSSKFSLISIKIDFITKIYELFSNSTNSKIIYNTLKNDLEQLINNGSIYRL